MVLIIIIIISYLKPNCCLQTYDYFKLYNRVFVSDSNTWYYIVSKS